MNYEWQSVTILILNTLLACNMCKMIYFVHKTRKTCNLDVRFNHFSFFSQISLSSQVRFLLNIKGSSHSYSFMFKTQLIYNSVHCSSQVMVRKSVNISSSLYHLKLSGNRHLDSDVFMKPKSPIPRQKTTNSAQVKC